MISARKALKSMMARNPQIKARDIEVFLAQNWPDSWEEPTREDGPARAIGIDVEMVFEDIDLIEYDELEGKLREKHNGNHIE